MAVKYVIIHHTAVSRAKAPFQWKQTNDYHKQEFGLKSSLGFYVGYTYLIESDGTVKQARKIGEEQTAQKGFNKNTISICFTGNFDVENPTKEQIASYRKLIRQLMDAHNFTPDEIVPHRFLCGSDKGTVACKTLNGKKAYKTCYGSRLSDTYFKDVL